MMKNVTHTMLLAVATFSCFSLNAAQITNLSVTGGGLVGAASFGGAFPFITSGPTAFSHFGGYNLVTDFPTTIGWDPGVQQLSADPTAVTGFSGNSFWVNFFMAESHVLDFGAGGYIAPSGTVGVLSTIANGDTIVFDMDSLLLNWNMNVFNVGGVAVGTVANVSGNTFDYTMAWSGLVNGGTFDGSEYNLTFTGTGSVVPVPGAIWLLISGLLGLIGVARTGTALSKEF